MVCFSHLCNIVRKLFRISSTCASLYFTLAKVTIHLACQLNLYCVGYCLVILYFV